MQKHINEIPKKFDLWVYRFYNMAAKLTFTTESSQLHLQRQHTAKNTHELIITITLLSSSSKLKWNQKKTEDPSVHSYNTHKTCKVNTTGENIKCEMLQKVSAEKLPASKMRMFLQTRS